MLFARKFLIKILSETFHKALEQEKLNMAGMPKIDIKHFSDGKPLEYNATFEIYPTFDLVTLKDIDIEQYACELTDDDVALTFKNLQKQHIKWEEVDRAAMDNDKLVIDFEGFIDGKPFTNGKAENFHLILGAHSIMPGVEKELLDKKAGDEFEIETEIPEKYSPSKDLAGKKATFKIKIHSVFNGILPGVNDDFAKKFGFEKGCDELRKNIKARMEKELDGALKLKNKKVVFDKLLDLNKIFVPQSLIDMEVNTLHKQETERIAEHTPSKEKPNIPKNIFAEQAKKRVTIGLLMAEAIKKYDIKPEEQKVRRVIDDIASSYERPESIVEWYYEDKSRLESVNSLIFEDEAHKKLLADAHIINKKVNYQEVLAF